MPRCHRPKRGSQLPLAALSSLALIRAPWISTVRALMGGMKTAPIIVLPPSNILDHVLDGKTSEKFQHQINHIGQVFAMFGGHVVGNRVLQLTVEAIAIVSRSFRPHALMVGRLLGLSALALLIIKDLVRQ